jgi:beta-mannosidase
MHFPAPETWEDLIYYGQANQAEALKCGVEHWRRRKGRCWGTLFWQINDCWPVHSWAVIDSTGEPKAAHFASKRFHAPLLLSLVLGEGKGVRAAIHAHLINDTLAAVPGTVEIRLLAFDGEELARTAVAVAAPANAASGPVASLEVPTFATHHETDVFVHATFTTPGGVLAENFLFLAEPKDLRLPDPGLGWEVTEPRNGEAVLTVTTHRFAGYVWLYVEGLREPADLSDNWFHLAPGQTRGVRVTNLPLDLDADALRARLRVRHL